VKKVILCIILILIVTSYQVWSEGTYERDNKIHPGAKMILEGNGYKFDSNNNLISYNKRPIVRFPNEDDTNTNPHVYEKNTIYLTTFDVNQWVDKSILATTGSELARQRTRAILPPAITVMGGGLQMNGTRIFIQNIPDRFLREIGSSVKNAFLLYTGAQTFKMADGSSQVFPVFQLIDLFGDTVSQAIHAFNNVFEAGIYKTADGYQYARINGRTFGRDIATKRELHEWNGSQWIILIGE